MQRIGINIHGKKNCASSWLFTRTYFHTPSKTRNYEPRLEWQNTDVRQQNWFND